MLIIGLKSGILSCMSCIQNASNDGDESVEKVGQSLVGTAREIDPLKLLSEIEMCHTLVRLTVEKLSQLELYLAKYSLRKCEPP